MAFDQHGAATPSSIGVPLSTFTSAPRLQYVRDSELDAVTVGSLPFSVTSLHSRAHELDDEDPSSPEDSGIQSTDSRPPDSNLSGHDSN